ncbi:MAG: hypothetical protein CMN60_05080 [Sphingobium sp.]|uniref:hypothetical protein n=1 Tax=Sphingomonas melonis TaxID=152682 RepID=UPI000C678BB2|nr:hypothetical protein [Sphingomonas melonis]MBS47098.1 hypothetical protein [Sphingobium sp.]|tara:strand:- start:785 stop:1141 length:357 start_codon:yes stop_codon:yes gene_type:complete
MFLDFAEAFTEEVSGSFTPKTRGSQELDRLTMQVAQLSRQDSLRSVSQVGRMRRLIERVFDIQVQNPLADARLEALRRYCVLFIHGDSRAQEAEADLLNRGYSPESCRLIRAVLQRET